MALKEMLMGADYKDKSTSEKLARLSKMVDAGTILGALVFFGIAPVIALAAIEANVVTGSAGQITEDWLKRRKKK